MRFISVAFICCFISVRPSFSQTTHSVKGKVRGVDGGGVPGATVKIVGGHTYVTTDSSGSFQMMVPSGGRIMVSSIGFETRSFIVQEWAPEQVFLIFPNYTKEKAVSIVGSRGKPRSDVSRPVPVDVITVRELTATGQTDLAQMVQFTSPSFVSVKTGLNGVANYADPASLKGMSSDQSLVLVNGKRRHQFSAISNTLVPGRGAVVTDLNAIPALALERMEIMRDGASAQYGSDAIAGIVNLILSKRNSGFEFKTDVGVTARGDGLSYGTGVNSGLRLGKDGGFLNMTLQYQHADGTDRSDPYTGRFYTDLVKADDSIRNARGVWPTEKSAFVLKYGSNRSTALQSFINAAVPLDHNWKWYGFGGTSHKDITAYGFFRTAKPTDPNGSALYPDGYTPLLPGKTADYSFFTGFEHKSGVGWTLDIGAGYGHDHLDLYARQSCNPSLGLLSPVDFYVGRNAFSQIITELNLARSFHDIGPFGFLNVAAGTQFRHDAFRMKEGEPDSYAIGPLAASQNKLPGSSGRPGISPDDRTYLTRVNIGTYFDLEGDLSEKFMVSVAGRFEHYSDFGGNLSGKLAARWTIFKAMSLRGSVNRGFRAPSLQQIGNGQSTSNAQNGVIRQTKQLPSGDPRLDALGIPDPKAEMSWSYNLGVTAKSGTAWLVTLDAYRIDVRDRIIISEVLPVNGNIPALWTVFPPSTGIKEIAFFTNHINTRTVGLDLVVNYRHALGSKGKLQATLALTMNKTLITGEKEAPAALTEGALVPVKLIDTISRSLITSAQPRQKLIAGINYSYRKWQADLRITRFGSVTAWEKPQGMPHRSQTFGARTVTDLSFTYRIMKELGLTLGANNLFNVYPERINSSYASYTSGQIPFSRSALQYGFNGRFYYISLRLRL